MIVVDGALSPRIWGYYWVLLKNKWVIARCSLTPLKTVGNYWDNSWRCVEYCCNWKIAGCNKNKKDSSFNKIGDIVTETMNKNKSNQKEFNPARECGFYWVRFLSEGKGEIAYWNGRYWELTGNEKWFYDRDFSEIDKNKIIKS